MAGTNGGQVVLTPGVIAEVDSASNPGEKHQVRLSKKGLIYCDCDGWRWRSHCRHVDVVIAQNPAVKLMVKAGLRERISQLEATIKALDES